MNVHVNHCYTMPTETDELLQRHWMHEAPEARFWPAQPKESHPELLTRIWRHIRAHPGKHLIAELDFIPLPGSLKQVERLLDTYRAVLVGWSNRNGDGHLNDLWPMTGPWFMAFNTEGVKQFPPDDWFDTLNKPIDVGCPTFAILLDSGFCGPHQVYHFRTEDERNFSGFYACRYDGLGVHCFYARCFAALDESQLGNIEGVTVGEHKRGIARLLEGFYADAKM